MSDRYVRSKGAEYGAPLDTARRLAQSWLDGAADGCIPPTTTVEQVKEALGRTLPPRGPEPCAVVERLAAVVEPALMRMGSPRFHGWVIGGTQPVGLAADWLVSAWDQNTILRTITPGVAAAEELATEWLADLFGLPAATEIGFVTGATAANLVGIVAGRNELLRRAGWNPEDGLCGAPRVRLLRGAECHGSIPSSGTVAGLGAGRVVGVDDQGRMLPSALREALAADRVPAVVCLQAGNIHSGAFDPFAELVEIAHAAGAWVHVDGAFGLWAAASPRLRALTTGMAEADSWATDAHKTLNTPYDCGIAAVAHSGVLRRAVAQHGVYLASSDGVTDPCDRVLELSRRVRGVPVYATLAQLGREGVVELVERLAGSAALIAEGLRRTPGVEVLNDVLYTQVCAAFGSDERTRLVGEALLAEGTALASPSIWHDRAVLRFSVSNWLTDADQAQRTVAAVRRAVSSID